MAGLPPPGTQLLFFVKPFPHDVEPLILSDLFLARCLLHASTPQ